MGYFFIFLVFLAMTYFLYNISESLIDIRDELRAANRDRDLVVHEQQGASAKSEGA